MFEPSVILYWGNNSYRASQFAIKLDGPFDPNTIFEDIRNRPPLRSLFLHEYIHFLQDVTTRYGLMKAANMYAYTSQIAHCIRTDTNNRFITPQTISQGQNVDNVILFNSKTWKYSLGCGFDVRTKYEGKCLEVSNITSCFFKIQETPIEQIELTIKEKGKNEIGKICFGGEIMSESMAFIAEQLYSAINGVRAYNAHDYPYRITELLVERIYPELAQKRDIIYLCIDACLYWSFNPGPTFYHLLVGLKNRNFHDDWELDMITEILKKQIGEPVSFESCVAETIRLVKHDFQISALHNTVKWLERIYKRAGVLRQYPMFMKCFVGNRYNDIQFSQIVIDILGIPPLHNDIHEASQKIPQNMLTYQEAFDVHPEFFNAIACLLSVFNNKMPCSMKQFCQASKNNNPNIEVNNTCDTPWQKLDEATNGNKQLCPFAFLWKHWGLAGKTPI